MAFVIEEDDLDIEDIEDFDDEAWDDDEALIEWFAEAGLLETPPGYYRARAALRPRRRWYFRPRRYPRRRWRPRRWRLRRPSYRRQRPQPPSVYF